MITLHHGCWMGEPKVFPRNWRQVGASIKIPWYIHFYFHDPAFAQDPKLKNGKLRIIKGMNMFTNISQRRDATKCLIEDEIRLLRDEGYNPITKKYCPEVEINYVIHPSTPFTKALKAAADRLQCTAHTKEDLRSVIKYFSKAAMQLRYDGIQISEVRRKHIKLILEHCANVKKHWSENQYNTYRKYLLIIFKELVELEACEFNPVKEISKKKCIIRIRTTLTQEERKRVDVLLKEKQYNFWRFLHIFFHSGSRISEMLRLQGKDIDLANQRFKYLMRKGKDIREKWKTIKDVALPLWQEVMNDCKPEDFLFAKGLQPGIKAIRPDQITRRWKLHVKDKMNIVADFYSLKHLNLDETAEALSIEYAARMAGHSTPVITLQHYAVGEKERIHNRLKTVNNPFA